MHPERLELETGTLVRVPAGVFTMGSDDARARPCERPQHRARVGAFYIDRCSVTNALFARFCAETDHRTTAELLGRGEIFVDGAWRWMPGASWRHPLGPGSGIESLLDHPVVLVSVGDALAFCAWRSRVERRRFRLPTEAEWERAARGTDGRTYPWGEEEVDQGGAMRARFNPGEPIGTAPVGTHPLGASPCGALDLAGNVWEWCLDAFDEHRCRRAREGVVRVDRGGPLSLGRESVFRGGSWIFPRDALRASGRHSNDMVRPSAGIGFRTVQPDRDPPELRARELVRRTAFTLHWLRWRVGASGRSWR